MSKPKIKIGVVGVGYHGWHHARIYSSMKDVDLLAVVDSNSARAEEVADRCQSRAEADYKKLIEYTQKAITPQAPKAQVQERDETGVPLVDGEGNAIMIDLPEGTTLHQVKGFYHGTTKDGTSVLKVVVDGKPWDSKYGHIVWGNSPVTDWKSWSAHVGNDTPALYAPPEGAKNVIMRPSSKNANYADIVEFRD